MDSANQFLEMGDLLEFKTAQYAHWGIYDGSGYVIHVTGEARPQSSLPDDIGNVIAATVGDVISSVKREQLQDVAQGRSFYKNNMLDGTYPPLCAEDIIKRASSLIGTEWDYRLLFSNCEHFASEMRYGVAISLQAVDAKRLIKKVATAGAVTGTAALIGTLKKL